MLGVRGDRMSEDEIGNARNRSVKLECYFLFSNLDGYPVNVRARL